MRRQAEKQAARPSSSFSKGLRAWEGLKGQQCPGEKKHAGHKRRVCLGWVDLLSKYTLMSDQG